jgi:hypothetical protein
VVGLNLHKRCSFNNFDGSGLSVFFQKALRRFLKGFAGVVCRSGRDRLLTIDGLRWSRLFVIAVGAPNAPVAMLVKMAG